MIVLRNRRLAKEALKLKKFSAVPNAASFFNRKDVLERIFLECMKLMEMHSMDNGAYVKHWIDKIGAILEEASKYFHPAIIFSIPVVDRFEELSKYIGTNEIKYMVKEFKDSDGLIDAIRHRMLTETNGENPKYERWFKDHKTQISNKDFKYFMKFIALIYSNQLTEVDASDYWDKSMIKYVNSTKVKPVGKSFAKMEELKQLIKAVLSGFAGIDYQDK